MDFRATASLSQPRGISHNRQGGSSLRTGFLLRYLMPRPKLACRSCARRSGRSCPAASWSWPAARAELERRAAETESLLHAAGVELRALEGREVAALLLDAFEHPGPPAGSQVDGVIHRS